MRVPLSWLREHVDLPRGLSAAELAARLTALGLKLEALTSPGSDVSGPLVVGRVLSADTETHSNGKSIQWCRVDVGPEHNDGDGRGIVCGAHNFGVGDLVVVALPGTVLPGGLAIGARKTYGHISDGMICSALELGLGDDHTGIIVLAPAQAEPGEDAAGVLHLRDDVIEFEINPDRAYALSVRGVARDAALGCDAAYRDPAGLTVDPGPGESYPVVVEDTAACPVFVTRTVSGFDPATPTPRWLARRIQLVGMRPISLAVDVTNYVMLELGQPIHGYDRDRLQGPIVVRRARPGETLRTLDGAERTLESEDLLITDDRGPIGMAGVMGGEATEIRADTTAVVIEAAHFAPVPIARTARRHRLISEASRRFERGADPLLPQAAAQRVADLLVELGGGVVEPGVTVVGTAPAQPEIAMAVDLPARITGIDIDAAQVVAALRAVGCTVPVTDEPMLSALPPSWRPDITDPYDLVEEVARVVGYDRVPSVLPVAPTGRGRTTAQRLRRRIGQLLAGAGCTEVIAYPFVGTADLDALGLPADDPRRRTIRLVNPLSTREPLLHTTLAAALLGAAARNTGRGQQSLSLSLVAPVFLPAADPAPAALVPHVDRRPTDNELKGLDNALPTQPRHLAVLLSGDRSPAGWWGPATPAGWADAIAVVRTVASGLGLVVEVRQAALAPWHPGRCAQVLLDGAVVGHAGELHPSVCAAYGVAPRTAYAEVDLDLLVDAAAEVTPAPVFSTMPVAKEDVALVVDEQVPVADVADALRAGAGELLESVRLFDVYRGDPVPVGHKSLAFALRFRAPDRTLTEHETGQARAAAVAEAAARTGAEQRS
ncbi:phenylalanine--tRNA ligase subunit beta [soil metagenome]